MSDSFVTPWTVARQVPLSMGFSRQEYWSGLPCPSPRDLPDSGIEPMSLMSPESADGFFTTSTTWKALSLQGGGWGGYTIHLNLRLGSGSISSGPPNFLLGSRGPGSQGGQGCGQAGQVALRV